MIDRAIGILGLLLTIIFGLLSVDLAWLPKVPAWVIYTGIGLGIFLVGLTIGLLRSNKRDDLKPQSVQQPNFKLSMVGGNIFSPGANDISDTHTGIGIIAKVWNTGAPSLATEWLLFVIPENVTPVIAQLTEIPETLLVGGPINGTVIRASESLEAKTKNTPVQAAPVEGTLLFYAAMKREIVLAPSTRFELIVKDIDGKETKTTQVMGDWLQR